MVEEDVCKTAITTPLGLFQFNKMPFGLRNTAQTFQRSMDEVTCVLDFIFVYIDSALCLMTDASDVAVGAVLQQKVENHWQPLGFFSKRLQPTETPLHVGRELLAEIAFPSKKCNRKHGGL